MVSSSHQSLILRSRKVAVIGAGPAGLVTARELRLEGHTVTIFERSDRIGGQWVYTPETDSDPSDVDPTRNVVHGSLYRSLRTNLPRPLMDFTDYPFPLPCDSFGDPRFFPGHKEVLAYLERFARDTGVIMFVKLRTEVVRVRIGRGRDEWLVEFRSEGEDLGVEVFEAVVVCNGHHTQPRLANIPGIDKWPGRQIHSHNYRIPEPFRNQIVVIIGKGSSAHDISRELSKVAKEIHLASRSPDVEVGKLDGYCNVWQHPMIRRVCEDGQVVFNDGSSLYADIILHCTGYNYHFPFLEASETVSVNDNRVHHLYKHVFPPHLAPSLSFVGLPSKVLIFISFELQAKWVAQVLSQKIELPSEEDMISSINEYYQQMEETGKPKHYTHALYPNDVEFLNWLAAEAGLPQPEDWRIRLYHTVLQRIMSEDDEFRETLDADYWMQKSQL